MTDATPTPEELAAAEATRQEAIDVEPTAAEIEKYSPAGADLEVPGGTTGDDLRHAVVSVFDRADEEMILAELGGRVLDEYFYEFESGGTTFFDLSYIGVREAARTANRQGAGISCPEAPIVNEEKDEKGVEFYRVIIRAIDAHGGSQWGTAVEPKMMTRRNKPAVWDKFALAKAINKAQRNAMRALLPVPVIEAMKSSYKGDEARVRKISRGLSEDNQMAELPPPADSEKAKKLRGQIETAYEALREVSRTALTPALYRSYLERSNHDEVELERFLGWLKTSIEDEKAKLAATPAKDQSEGKK